MKFCSDCDTRFVQSYDGVGGPLVCPKCNPEKILVKEAPTYGVNYSGRTKQCSKVCGAEIYWDECFKSDSRKFIPIDSQTDEPHRCDGPTKSGGYFPDEIKKYSKTKVKDPTSNIPIPESVLYDISKIPKSLIANDGIIREIIQGHKEESFALIYYERLIAPEIEKILIESLKDILSENILKGLAKYGFTYFLPFQEESIRKILKGNNSIISAPTGSGKTEAFIIPIL